METTIAKGEGKYQCAVSIGQHKLSTDVPVELGGEDHGPEPHDLLAAALGSCTVTTLLMYAEHKGWNLQDANVTVTIVQQGDIYHFSRHIVYRGELDQEQRKRLTDIANKCPVHRILTGNIEVKTTSE